MSFPDFGHTCVVGLQWGDEGKGKIVDVLVPYYHVVVRYGGGANAGHTVVVSGEKFALHQLPSGILHSERLSVIANGAVVDPAVLLGEIQSLRQRGLRIGENLRISDRAHVVFPYHRREDQLSERAAGPVEKIGTTGRGIGPCYADKASRHLGIRIADILDPARLRERLSATVSYKNALFRTVYEQREQFDVEAILSEYTAFADQLRPFVCDTALLLREQMDAGKRVLFEGAQGSLLDVDHGTYPFVTSSNTGPGGVSPGAGVPPTSLRTIVGVVKAYTTRVGAGPFPTELKNSIGDTIRERGGEYGTTTGRPRRCGWFDAVAASNAALTGGPTHLAVMHLDTLSGMDELPVCVGYRRGGSIVNRLPADTYHLDGVEPVYERLPGWSESLNDCRRLADLPANTRGYVDFIARRLGAPVRILSVGPGREQTILVEDSAG
ncbi:MAG: adenylosuccinate synthase [Planctomycetia bacterium]|nr:MAG: adenylosuccinate synthase [Planctomycetia bacterium]